MKAFLIATLTLTVAAAWPAAAFADQGAAEADRQDEAAGRAAPAEGEAAPAEGEAAPAEGESAPAEGEAAPAEGEAAAAEGEKDPAGGEAAPAEGEAAGTYDPSTFADREAGTFWMPPQASHVADEVDWLFYGITGLSIFCFVAITIAVIYFCIRYRARPGHAAEPSASHNDALEITWTVLPSIIVVVIFVLGWKGYMELASPPGNAHEVRVTGQKWNWQFSYPNGWTDDALHVPVDEPVRLVMKSQDVLHSFFVPAFRVKQDVLPNRYTRLWFEPTEEGTFRAFCTEYCGQQHSDMKTRVIVHPPGGYENYLAAAEEKMMNLPPVELGELLYEKRGCKQCHSLDGSTGKGPSFQGIWGSEHQFRDGSSAVVDENYVRESVLDPQAKVRAGFNPVMPTFKGKLDDRDIEAIIAFLKSQK